MNPCPTIEDVKAYWDNRPCNIRHSQAVPGSLQWSKEVTQRKYFVEPHIPQFADFSSWRGKRVLEIGCGIGTDTLEFGRAGAFVDAVELSPLSLALARERVKRELGEMATIRFYNENAENGLHMLPDFSYDLVYSFGVIHHSPHPVRILNAALRHLKPGGELRIMLYSKYSWKNFTRQQPEAQHGCPIARTFGGGEVRALLEVIGFDVISIQKAHIFPWKVSDYVEYKYVKEFPWSVIPQKAFSALETVLGWHLLIKAKPMQKSTRIWSPRIRINYGSEVRCES